MKIPAFINTDAKRHWYFLGSLKTRHFGNYLFHFIAAVLYTVAAITPVITFVFGDSLSTISCLRWLPDFFRCNPFEWIKEHPGQFVCWAFGLALSFPLFAWIEAIKFENWLQQNQGTVPLPIEEREWFRTNARYVENFWKAVGGFFLAAGLLSSAEKWRDKSSNSHAEPKNKTIEQTKENK